MLRPRGLPHVALLVLLAAGAPGRAAPAPAGADGPLPKGVLARLGTDRLRHEHNVLAAAFAPDGKTVVSVGAGWHLRSWDLTGKQIRRVPLDVKKSVAVTTFTPDGKTLLLAGYDGKVRLFDVRTGKELGTVVTKPGPASLALSPDRKTLVTGHQNQAVCVWDVEGGKEKSYPAELTPRAPALAFTPDGKHVLTGWTDNTLRLLDPAAGKEVRSFPLPNAKSYGRKTAVFSPDGKWLAGVGWDYTVHLWDAATGKRVRQLPLTSPPPYSGSLNPSVAFAPDGKTLAAGGPGTVQVWDLKSGKELRRIKAHTGFVHSVAFSPNGKTLVSAGRDQAVGLWDVATGNDLAPRDGHRGAVRYVAFGRGRMLFSAGDDGTARLWDVDTGNQEELVAQLPGPVTAFAVLRGGTEVMSTAHSGGIHVWRAGVGRGKPRWTGISVGGTVPMLFTPDGKTWVMGFGGQIWVRDPGPGKPKRTLETPRGPGGMISGAVRLGASPDGRLLAAAYRDNSLRLWDLASGKEVRRMSSGLDDFGGARPNGLVFAPDGRTLAGSGFGTLHLWEVATGQECVRFPALSKMTALAFSPDGRLLAVAQEADPPGPGTLRVLDTATGKELGRTTAHRGAIESLAFSADGKLLASGGRDTTILVWQVAAVAELPKPPATALSDKQLEARWDDLADADAKKAHRAIWALAQSPRQAVPFLRERFEPPGRPDAKRVARLIKDLDADDFETREKATKGLEELGAAVEDDLRKALADDPSAEAKERLRGLLAKVKKDETSPAWRRLRRALAVLERAGTPDARAVLEALSRRKLDAALAEQVRATLKRMGRRR